MTVFCGQLVQLPNDLPGLHELGADVIAVSVDSPGRHAALAARWRLPFPIFSDPGGIDVLQQLDLWSPHERGGIGWPAIVVFGPDDHDVRRFRARDFADRRGANIQLRKGRRNRRRPDFPAHLKPHLTVSARQVGRPAT